MLEICEKSGQLYFLFDSALWLLHMDNMNETPAIPLELAVDLMRHNLKDIN
jgi:hypothetical protein